MFQCFSFFIFCVHKLTSAFPILLYDVVLFLLLCSNEHDPETTI